VEVSGGRNEYKYVFGVDAVCVACRRAQALIALLCEELDLVTPNSNAMNYPRTMAALVHPDGWDKVAKAFSAALIANAGNGKALAAPAV
jgi:hypothetical protein